MVEKFKTRRSQDMWPALHCKAGGSTPRTLYMIGYRRLPALHLHLLWWQWWGVLSWHLPKNCHPLNNLVVNHPQERTFLQKQFLQLQAADDLSVQLPQLYVLNTDKTCSWKVIPGLLTFLAASFLQLVLYFHCPQS